MRPRSGPSIPHRWIASGGTVTTTRKLVSAVLSVSLAITPFVARPVGAQAPVRIPAIAGVTVVTAISEIRGDYEAIEHIDSKAPDGSLSITVSGQVPNPLTKKTEDVVVVRAVSAADLESARTYKYVFYTQDEAQIPGTTAIGTSAAVVNDVRSTGHAAIAVNGEGPGIASLLSSVVEMMSDSTSKGTLSLGMNATGTVAVAEPKPVPFPVMLNGHRVVLQAWHLRGRLDDEGQPVDVDWYVLDDPTNPLMLRYTIGRSKLEVVRIELPATDSGKVLEHELRDDRRTVLYGIYFDFNSATLRPQSEPVLREIVQVMQREPTWSLRIEGHTDSVGGDAAANKLLSAQRAEAVKAALIQRGVSATRLDTQGLGSTLPRETNATLQGRARNRRVELTRE
jgi:outer membrane protein OmpA-like peptidoglycan-associated protein